MKSSEIHILIESQKNIPLNPGIRVVCIQELIGWIKSGHYWRHLFRYRKSRLMVERWESMTGPFGTALVVYLLSRKTASIHDKNKKEIPITLSFLFRLLISFVKAYFKTPGFLRQKLREIEQITKSLPTQPIHKTLDMNRRPVYLRTDYVLNLKAGGSIGHTAGVLNQLSAFTGPPLLISAIALPTVNDNIETHVFPPSGHYMDFQELMNLDYNDQLRQATQGLLKNFHPSFIYQRYSTNNYIGVELAQKLRVPFIVEYNGSEIWVNKHWGKNLKHEALANKIELLNLNSATVVVVVSQPLKDELVSRGVDFDKILVNPNGVDPDVYSPKANGSEIRRQYNLEGQTVIGFIGTFGKWHGAEVLVKAYGWLLKRYPGYCKTTHLLMIGDGNTMPQVRKEIDHLGIADKVTLTGTVPQEEGPMYLAACDLLASPHVPNPDGTPFFGSPTKLFEYMALGKGIIASNLDQIGEILEHDRTAWLVKPGHVESLMLGMKALIDDPEKSKRLGESARQEIIAQYTWKEHTRKIIDKLKERCLCD